MLCCCCCGGGVALLKKRGGPFIHHALHCQAVSHYLEAIRIDPYFADAYCNLGNAYRDMGSVEEALNNNNADNNNNTGGGDDDVNNNGHDNNCPAGDPLLPARGAAEADERRRALAPRVHVQGPRQGARGDLALPQGAAFL